VVKFNKTNHYGRLSGRNIEDMLACTEILTVKVTKEIHKISHFGKKPKRNILCDGLHRWIDGFSGWHLECTAMSTKYLTIFDIHGGGMDLNFRTS
jgi:cysteinyl-tRNA synthetase